ncbi:MBL fold metallo-hydrolase [Nocardioides sp. GY 10127]|uniref:MBL fold metallo-hydrolase n=1 Tax=Nocardioides sp. GY 10127 TaxID=2569762 RepID=UPI0014583738|nr:MBL fold metallo-hydrolase [Nocardioides sp. GY 10127]
MPRVSAVHVLRCGRVRVRPQNLQRGRSPELWWTATSRRWSAWLPVNVVLVVHEEGVLLFDTGQSPRSLAEPDYYPGRRTGGLLGAVVGWAFRRQAQFEVPPTDTLVSRLAEVGLSPADVDTVVLSHLHQDHAGNLDVVPGARVLLAPEELALLSEPHPELHGVLPGAVVPHDADLQPLSWSALPSPLGPGGPGEDPAFTAGHDLYGDGTLVALPTPGHSPGSVSLLVRRPDGPPLLLVGDLTYDCDRLERGALPGTGDAATQEASSRAVLRLRESEPGLVVVPAHDATATTGLDLKKS